VLNAFLLFAKLYLSRFCS